MATTISNNQPPVDPRAVNSVTTPTQTNSAAKDTAKDVQKQLNSISSTRDPSVSELQGMAKTLGLQPSALSGEQKAAVAGGKYGGGGQAAKNQADALESAIRTAVSGTLDNKSSVQLSLGEAQAVNDANTSTS